MRFSITRTATDSSDKTHLICSTILLCLFAPNTILMEAGWTTLPSPATNLSILTCKSSARTKQSVISVARKTPLEIRLRICIYKMSLLHRPYDYIGFTPSCPPHILQQNFAHVLWWYLSQCILFIWQIKHSPNNRRSTPREIRLTDAERAEKSWEELKAKAATGFDEQ